MDARLRELERTWKETGAEADRAAFLAERVRQGDLTAERLHLAAYLGDQVCRRLHEEPKERIPIPPKLTAGVKEAIEAVWREALERRPLSPSTRAALAAAAEIPQLRRLRPVPGPADTLSFSRCVDAPFTPSPVILPVSADLPTTFLVQADLLGEEFLGAPEDPRAAVALIAKHITPDQPVWRGSRHAVHIARVEAGALDDPRCLDEWLSALTLWDSGVVVRGVAALTQVALPLWKQDDPGPRRILEATLAHMRDPSDPTHGELIRRMQFRDTRRDAASDWVMRLCAACSHAVEKGRVVYYFEPDRVLPDAELKDVVRAALIPWALGEGDPLLD